ncbi:hypothetical protein BT96DRAFT_1041065, partial [Gymnopus androsaceus JB14]
FRIADVACLFKTRSPLVWYLTECMAAPQKKGVLIQVAAISSFILSRNQYANSYMAMHMGIWHIACGSHVDVKRVASHLAMSVHETTARQALATMVDTSLENLRTEVGQGQKRYQVLYQFVLDNIQEFLRVWEGGTGLKNRLICGTACTAIGLDDCTDDAFNFVDRLMRILKNERAELTVQKIVDLDINWTHVSNLFCTKYTIHCMREGRKTQVVPLGTNAEHEIKTAGMKRCLNDFFTQAAVSPEYALTLIPWVGGDGGSVLAIDRAQKYLAPTYDPNNPESDYKTLQNILPTIGIWHEQSTAQNTIAENHYGPVATNDPSALSQSAACAGFKRPTNFKDYSNYYNLSHSMTAFWETQILDCWRLELGLDHWNKIIPYSHNLSQSNRVLNLEWFLEKAECIVNCYMLLDAFEQALSAVEANESVPDPLKFPVGDPYSPPVTSHMNNSSAKESALSAHEEKKEFTGDCVLANSILFKTVYSWWIEASYAIPEGDIGRVWEVMKVNCDARIKQS